jgi:hypothetical protein
VSGRPARLRRRDDEGDGRGRGSRRRERSCSSTARRSRSSSARRSPYVAENADELASIDADAEAKPAPKPAAGDRKATRKAVELASFTGRPRRDRQARLHHGEGRRGSSLRA